MNREHIPEEPDMPLDEWVRQRHQHEVEEKPVYHPRTERPQRLALVVLAILLAIVGTMAAIKARAQTATRSATLTFTKPTKYTDGSDIAAGTAISYYVYQAKKGEPKVRAGGTITGQTTTISTGLQAGTEYCWQVSAVIQGTESALSNEACKAFAFPTPETVTITVT